MKLLIYQIIIFLIGAVFIAKTFSHYLRKEQTLRELVAVLLFWAAIFALNIVPEAFGSIAQFLGFKEYINGLFIGGFIILFYAVFKLIVKTDKQERQITELVRKLAFDNAKKD
jgi:hypothetical protein